MVFSYGFEFLKKAVATTVSHAVEQVAATQTLYLETYPLEQRTQEAARNLFERLNVQERGAVYGKVWELGKMNDPRIAGERWGEENALVDPQRLAAAMHRLGLLGDGQARHTLTSLCHGVGEGGLGAQYFSLGDCLGRDPATGQIGYVNGMGVPSLEHAGRDTKAFSDMFAGGNNIHVVYNSTHQSTPQGDTYGFAWDLVRLQSINGGSYTRTSYLAAQQIIDFLNTHPDQNWLQIAHSEGSAHVNAALRLIQNAQPDLLGRIRVITFCPAYFINPSQYPGTQIVNFVKREDGVVNPLGQNASLIGTCAHIVTVNHTGDHPHNHLSEDFRRIAKPYVDRFIQDGDIHDVVIVNNSNDRTTAEITVNCDVGHPTNMLGIRDAATNWNENRPWRFENGQWKGTIPLGVEFKFVSIPSDGNVRWEEGLNRSSINEMSQAQNIIDSRRITFST